MTLRHISDVIGDPEVFVQHMVKDAMRRADETLPPPDLSDEELNHNEVIKQWEEENNRCKIILIGQDGARPRQKKSSVKQPHSTTTAFAKKHITQWGNDVF